jgi:hypothetical protein
MKCRWPGKAGDDEVRWRSSGEQSCTREGGKPRRKKAGDDDHLHAELLWRAGAMEQRRSGTRAAHPKRGEGSCG